MASCPACGADLARVRRSSLEKLLYAQAYRCRVCGRRSRRLRGGIVAPIGFLASRRTRCVRCGNEDVRRVPRRDRTDDASRNLLSRLLSLTGAPQYSCRDCRLRYHDWRPRVPKMTAGAHATIETTGRST